jgi:hypothetical protein
MPRSAANWRLASSTRRILLSASSTMSRAPTSSAVTSVTLPSAQTAIF